MDMSDDDWVYLSINWEGHQYTVFTREIRNKREWMHLLWIYVRDEDDWVYS